MKRNLEILVNFFALATLGVKGLRTEDQLVLTG